MNREVYPCGCEMTSSLNCPKHNPVTPMGLKGRDTKDQRISELEKEVERLKISISVGPTVNDELRCEVESLTAKLDIAKEALEIVEPYAKWAVDALEDLINITESDCEECGCATVATICLSTYPKEGV